MNQVCTRRWSRTLGCTGISLRGMAVVLVHLLPQFVKILIDGGGRGTSVNCYCSLWAPTVEGVLTIGTEETAELLIWHMRILAGLAHTPLSTSSFSNPPPQFLGMGTTQKQTWGGELARMSGGSWSRASNSKKNFQKE